MTDYQLLPNEGIILKATGVCHREGLFSGYEDELVLTNLHLIYVDRSAFGKVKSIQKIPLNLIRVYQGRAQVLCAKSPSDGVYELQLFMKDGGQDAFRFERGRKEALRWANEISLAATGMEAATGYQGETSIKDELKGMALGAIKGVLNIDDEAQAPLARFIPVTPGRDTPKRVTRPCIGCGAPLTGNTGQVVRCEYCDMEQVLKQED